MPWREGGKACVAGLKRKTENFVFSFVISLSAFRFTDLAVSFDVLGSDGVVGQNYKPLDYIPQLSNIATPPLL